ncbi:hypothetical protein GCM10008910_08930 [Faecalicatena orotica]|uniref:Uncharacterized protein DUF3796 n=1 Tax=Faecalicatena orotica TaxID=1544 RepID=A0A2Y9BMC8_9FIRM|nr:DUF3796 domain-containing protein [Faecalicatena orotica]PWJ23676.1 uncharacterized protein DUF3796 [Faecalicatena orotica]SSA57588.1 Protein of unknown function [Faecalicatena orotica]
MTKAKKHNPLSYLGWLGLVGVVGTNTGDWLLQLFLIYFFFFIYTNMPADELFWMNVRKAGFRAFIFEVAANSLILVIVAVLEHIKYISADMVTLVMRLYLISFVAAMAIFIAMLWQINRQERKYMEE